MRKIHFTCILLVFLSAQWLVGQESVSVRNSIDLKIEQYMDSLLLPGLSCAVIQTDHEIYKKSHGFANLEHRIPMTDSSVYRIWSVSKQFCAVSIFMLVNEKKLNIDDSIYKYLDPMPKEWMGITIRHLLNHTAGIKDYLNDFHKDSVLMGIPYERVIDSISALLFPAASDWRYSNSGYWVATKIIEQISGMPYQEYIFENFIKPLKMHSTFKTDDNRLVPNRVSNYNVKNGLTSNATRYLGYNFEANGDGELLSTLNDLSNWTKALMNGKVVPDKYLEYAWITARQNNGADVNASYIIYYDTLATYGMGWFISDLNGEKIVWTPGAGPGVSTCIMTVPEQKLSIIILCNKRRFLIADKLAREIAEIVLKEE